MRPDLLAGVISAAVDVLGAGLQDSLGQVVQAQLPVLDETGKIHGEIPGVLPPELTEGDARELLEDVESSIETRVEEQEALGEHGPHRARIDQERDLARRLRKKLDGDQSQRNRRKQREREENEGD
jgi:hypothetical protein